MELERELMRGAGPLAVLKLLESREMYGYELVEAMTKKTEGLLSMGQSTLYPMLYNLEAKGLVAGRVDESGARPRKYYRLTTKGKKKLQTEGKKWESMVTALGHLGLSPQSISPLLEGGVA
jgi:PadR family transcriptional regulator PadR